MALCVSLRWSKMQRGSQNGVDSTKAVKRGKTLKQASWDDYKDDIYELYAVQNYSIEGLMNAMAGKGLHASYVYQKPLSSSRRRTE